MRDRPGTPDTPTDSDFIFPDEICFDNVIRFGSEIQGRSGGWSRKFRATRSGRHIFVKALKPEFAESPFHRSLLRKEFEIGFGLSHLNIAQTLSHEHDAELGDIITGEFVDGPTLKEYIEASGKAAPPAERERILTEICDAAAYIHSQGLVHRDLKPSNIMLTARRHTVRLIDFGVADGDEWSAMKAPAGTPGYAAPEQYTPEGMTDSRSDIYAIGLIIRELLPDDKAALAVAALCTDPDPERRPQDAASIPALISKRRRAGRRAIAAVAVGSALIVVGIAWLSFPFRMSHDKAADPIVVADSVSLTAAPDTVALIAESKVEPVEAPSPAQAAAEPAAAPQPAQGAEAVIIQPTPASDSLREIKRPSDANHSGIVAQSRSTVIGDSLMALLREKTIQISSEHLRRHYKMCDTVSTQQSYVKARSRQWRIEAHNEAVRWFSPIYEEYREYFPLMHGFDGKVASFVDEYELENAGTILEKEMEAYERVGKPVPLAPRKVPFDGYERVWQMPDGSWAIRSIDSGALQYKAERAEERRSLEIPRQL